MHLPTKMICVAATVAATGFMAAPAQAAAVDHCPAEGGTKYELDAGPTTDAPTGATGLVCFKAGRNIGYAPVIGGSITNDQFMNKPETAYLGISYVVVYAYEEPCETSQCP